MDFIIKRQFNAMNKAKKGGFTLVEVIVVLVILAILMAIAIPALTGYMAKAREKAAVVETRSIVQALQTIATDPIASKGYLFQQGEGGHGGGKSVYGTKDTSPTWATVVSDLLGKDIDPAYINQIRFSNVKTGGKLRQVLFTTGKSGNYMYIFYLEGKYYRVPADFSSKNANHMASLTSPIAG